MSVDILGMFEQLAEHGHAPTEGCSLFGANYDSAFDLLRKKYLTERFMRGGSGEKFVIGPFGSGKTHFLRQLMESARALSCVTIEVQLNKQLDFGKPLGIYKEIAANVRAPGQDACGVHILVQEAVRRVRENAMAGGLPAEEVLEMWASGLSTKQFASQSFGRVAKLAVEACRTGDMDIFDAATAWLGGDVTSTAVAKKLGESPTSASDLKVFAQRARLSLFQFARHAGFQGTVLGFDEAEQGIATDKKSMAKVFSHLLSEINALTDAKETAALVVYAVTPDVIEKINEMMPMMAGRIADPGEGRSFFDGNALAPKIDLTRRADGVGDLARIGTRLAELFFERVPTADVARRDEAMEAVAELAREVAASEASSSARRDMVRRVCNALMFSYTTDGPGIAIAPGPRREAEV